MIILGILFSCPKISLKIILKIFKNRKIRGENSDDDGLFETSIKSLSRVNGMPFLFCECKISTQNNLLWFNDW